MEVVAAGDEGSDLPPDAAVDLDEEVDGAVALILGEGDAVVWGHGDVVSVEERGPHVNVLVALVDGRDHLLGK